MSQSLSFTLNYKQNLPDFTLGPLKNQPPLFKYKFLSKVLDPPNNNQEQLRTVTVKYLYQGYK
jgi:hypothetical protein